MKHVSKLELKEGAGDDATALVTKALDDFRAAFDARLKEIETKSAGDTKLKDRLDQLEAKMNRPGSTGTIETKSAELVAFESFLRGGAASMNDLEKKTLTVANNNVLAPLEYGREVLKLLRLLSPIRQYARVVSIGARQVSYPRRTGSTAASWVANETDARSESETSYEQALITPGELATYTDISQQLIEDNEYDLPGEISQDLAESFAIAEGTSFVSGSGTHQPTGLLTSTAISSMNTGNANGFPTSNPADVLIQMAHQLPTLHFQNGVWVMNRLTLGTLRQFKDNQGRYIVLDGLSQGAPPTLLGRPVVEAPDMPVIAAGNTPILLGDLQGYRIVDRISFNMLFDPYTLAASGQVRYHARRRVGGDVTHADRFIKLKVSA
jgi:HK97 family phage major capsid protein